MKTAGLSLWSHGPCSAASPIFPAGNSHYSLSHSAIVRKNPRLACCVSRKRSQHHFGRSVSKPAFLSHRVPRRRSFICSSMADHGQGSTDSLERSKGKTVVPVYVMMPLDTFSMNEYGVIRVKRMKALTVSLRALKLAGVQGVVVEVWWGIVERFSPLHYDWSMYEDLFKLVSDADLKLHTVLSFHASLHPCSSSRSKISLPLWVSEIGNSNRDIYYRDRHGFFNEEYLSAGVDQVPLFHGRTALECYGDFMSSFIEKFRTLIGGTIHEITIGLGPSGELRYPAHPSSDGRWNLPGIGEFQCYDKYMRSDLKEAAEKVGRPDWGFSGPLDAGSYNSFPLEEPFFRAGNGTFLTDYGQFFLGWYSGKLVQHADHVLDKASQLLKSCCQDQTDTAQLIAKVPGIHWWYDTESHAAELTAGYYNTAYRDGYEPLASVCAKYGTALNIPCLEMPDSDQPELHCSSPERLIEQIREAARQGNIPLTGENAVERFDKVAFSQIVRNAYCHPESIRAFTFFRMKETLFRPDNWRLFVSFVKQMYIKSHDGGCNGKMYSNLCKTG